MFKRFCAINHPTTSNYKNNIKIHLQDNFIIYLALPKLIVQYICFIKCVSLALTHRLTCRNCSHKRHIWCIFRMRGFTVIMPLPWQRPRFFFTTIHFLVQTYQAIKKNMVVLCSTVGRGYSYFYASFREWPQHYKALSPKQVILATKEAITPTLKMI